jgi:regulator of PEP synthase PpsR (kinase-PPPase family)
VVSDSVGETAELVTRATAAQFNAHTFDIIRIPHVEEPGIIHDIIAQAKTRKSVIVYTLILPDLRNIMQQEAKRHGIPAVDIMGPMLAALEEITTVRPKMQPGLVRRLDEEYFKRVEAVEFAVKCDDGKDPKGLLQADVVIIGVSRTSKTPVSLYLANRRWKVANVPLVPEVRLPEEIFLVPRTRIVGLTIDERHLREIRVERLRAMGLPADADYADSGRIAKEIAYADEVFRMLGCPVVDVSNKAVEETANTVIELVTRSGIHV